MHYKNILSTNRIKGVYKNIEKHVINTPLQYSERLSSKYNATIYLKREDLQKTRSFKLRGSLNKLLQTNSNNSIVCASAGNHAQGVAYSCKQLNLQATIFIPTTTPLQKINRIKKLGDGNINLKIKGDLLKDTMVYAEDYCNNTNSSFVHPYNDIDVILGQATIGLEILDRLEPDIIVSCIGGGGLIAGIGGFIKTNLPKCKIIGAEPLNANSMYKALENGAPYEINITDIFVDGASVSKVGDIPYSICKHFLTKNDIKLVSNGRLCNEMLELYENEGIIVEPAGALAVASLPAIEDTEGKTVVCIISGGNNDVMRYSEIIEKNLIYLNLKHYYIIKFNQKPQELKKFIINVLGKEDDITRFEYIKKTNKNLGNVLLGIETNDNITFETMLHKNGFVFQKIGEQDLIYNYIV